MEIEEIIFQIFERGFELALVMALVLMNSFFVAAEFALVKIRDTQLDSLVRAGHRRAKVARRVVQNLDASLSATQLGITLASLGLGWYAEPLFEQLLHPVMDGLGIQSPHLQHAMAFAVGFSIITFLHIVIGELAPKSLAIQKPLPTSLWVAHPLLWFYKASYPFIWLLNHTANWFLHRVGLETVSESEMVHSEEELRLLFSAAQQRTGGTTLGRDIVLNAMTLKRRIVREVMQPRREIVVLDTEATISQCLEIAEKTRYSRFPLCENGDLDETVGVIHFKDLIGLRSKVSKGSELVVVARKLIYVPETARLEKVLELFLNRKLHFAIVVDEYGGTVGMVTLEDILEELVGEIQDEFDQEPPMISKKGENQWEIQGSLPLHELGAFMGVELQEEDVTTTSGWITHQLEGFPKIGDVIRVGEYEFRVEEIDGPVVERLSVRRYPKPREEKE